MTFLGWWSNSKLFTNCRPVHYFTSTMFSRIILCKSNCHFSTMHICFIWKRSLQCKQSFHKVLDIEIFGLNENFTKYNYITEALASKCNLIIRFCRVTLVAHW